MQNRLTTILRVDSAANLAGAIVVAAFAGPLAAGLAIGATWPLYVTGGLLAVYGIEQWLLAGNATTPAVKALVALDIAFGAGLLAIAVTDPTGADTWIRWGLVAVADIALVAGAVKAYTLSESGSAEHRTATPAEPERLIRRTG